jgi:hypothetical protein
MWLFISCSNFISTNSKLIPFTVGQAPLIDMICKIYISDILGLDAVKLEPIFTDGTIIN